MSQVSRPGVVVPVPVDPAGLSGPTKGQARGPLWRRAGKGLYVPAATDPTELEQRIVEAVVGCGSGASATGWAALAWVGARWFNGFEGDGRTPLPVPVAIDDERVVRPRPGVEISEDWLFDGDVRTVDGLRVTTPERAVTFEVRRARTFLRAVQVVDMAAADDLVDLASLAAYTERLVARPGVRQLRNALTWGEENAWSPQEVTMRLDWKEARPRDTVLCNPPLFDLDGRHLLTPDLFDPLHGVAGEYDGVVHLDHGSRRRDLNRDALYRDLGIEVVTMMSIDRPDTTDFRARLRGAYRRAAQRDAHPRAWTLHQPDWWVDTSTVARRRALDEIERSIWLRRQAS